MTLDKSESLDIVWIETEEIKYYRTKEGNIAPVVDAGSRAANFM
jgi:hypothetical protein